MKTILLFSLFEKIVYCHLAFSVISICFISGHFPGLGQGFVSKNKTILIYTSESEKKPQSFNDSIAHYQMRRWMWSNTFGHALWMQEIVTKTLTLKNTANH